MPIYEYECLACGHTLDALQRLSEPPLTDCPECGEPKLRKRVSAPRFRLKGSGWYETDFKKENRRNLAEGSDKPAAGSKEGASQAGGDTAKPAGKDTAGKTGKGEGKSKREGKGNGKGDKAAAS